MNTDFRKKLIENLENKLVEFNRVIETMDVADKDYSRIVMDAINTDKTIAAVKEMIAQDEITSKNEDVVFGENDEEGENK